MDLSVNKFRTVALNNWFDNDIVLNADRDDITSQFFHSKSTQGSASRATNVATMNAFKEALIEEFGAFGKNAFESIVEERASVGRSLRKSDVLKTIAEAEFQAGRTKSAFHAIASEIVTRLCTKNPALCNLPEAFRAHLHEQVAADLDAFILMDAKASVETLKHYQNDLEAFACHIERLVWKTIDAKTFLQTTREAFEKLPAPTQELPLTGSTNVWTKGDTEAMFLDLNDPATRERMTEAFKKTVRDIEVTNPSDRMVLFWKAARANDQWKDPSAFLSFCREFVDRLPYSFTIATHIVLTEVLQQKDTPLCKAAKRILPELQNDLESCHIATHERLDLRDPNEIQRRETSDLFAESDLTLHHFYALLNEAKGALDIREDRVAKAHKDVKTYIQTAKTVDEKKLNHLSDTVNVLGEAFQTDETFYKSFKKKVDALVVRGNALCNTLKAERLSDDEKTRAITELNALKAELRTLTEELHNTLPANPANFREEDRMVILAWQFDGIKAEVDLEMEKILLAHQKTEVAIDNLHKFTDAINHQAKPHPYVPYKGPLDKGAQEDVLARNIAESFSTLYAHRENLLKEMMEARKNMQAIKDKVVNFKLKAVTEEDLRAAIAEAKKLKKEMQVHAELANSFDLRSKLSPADALTNPAMMLNLKMRCFHEVRKTIVSYAQNVDPASGVGIVLSRFL